MFFINRQYLSKISHDKIKKINWFICVRNINSQKHDNSKYIKLNFYIQNKKIDELTAITHFKQKVYVINKLKIELFINMNIIKLKTIIFNLINKTITIKNCDNFIIFLNVTFKNKQMNRVIQIIVLPTISFFTIMSILIKFRKRFIFKNKNYSFYLILNVCFKSNKSFYIVIVNANFVVVQIKNVINKLCALFKNVKIKQLRNYNKKKCYLIEAKSKFLTIVFVVE